MSDIEASRQVLEICDAAVLMPAAQRGAFLDETCGGDRKLRAAVDELLRAIEDSGSFLQITEPPEAT